MKAQAPQIGFDRFIPLAWADCALRIRAGEADIEALEKLLDQAEPGAAARKKTRTVLNRLWLKPRAELVGFADRGAELYRRHPATPAAALSWGMAISTYPFFGKVAEFIGRLSALQSDCASAEIHRRMMEIYGEREGTRRMTNRVIQTQVDWGSLSRTGGGKRLTRQPAVVLDQSALVAWLIEAAVRYSGRVVSLASLQSLPVLYPFSLNQSLAFAVSTNPYLEVREEGPAGRQVAIRP